MTKTTQCIGPPASLTHQHRPPLHRPTHEQQPKNLLIKLLSAAGTGYVVAPLSAVGVGLGSCGRGSSTRTKGACKCWERANAQICQGLVSMRRSVANGPS